MKKVQDYYFKKAKQENYPARSVYKLEEAQQKYRFMQSGDRVLDLGCHPGSWSLYAAKVVGEKGFVLGVDLQKTKIVHAQGSALVEVLCTDIFDPSFIDKIAPYVPFQVVISDLAPKTTGNRFRDHLKSVELSHRALEIACQSLNRGGNYYCKVFQGEDFSIFVDQVRHCFNKTKIVKPKSSRAESREVFVLGLELKTK